MNQTNEYPYPGTYDEAARQPSAAPSITDVLLAVDQEMRGVRERLLALETRLYKYDRIFERAFQDELESRVGGKNNYAGEQVHCGSTGPLESLIKWKLRQMNPEGL